LSGALNDLKNGLSSGCLHAEVEARKISTILMTMNEDTSASTTSHFGVTYKVDEQDCVEFAEALQKLGHDVLFVNWEDLVVGAIVRMFHFNQRTFITPLPLASIDVAFIYQMEGFYFNLARFQDMVKLFEQSCPIVINHPKTIRHNVDKRYLMALADAGVRVIPTFNLAQSIRDRLNDGERFILKPIFGERGNGIVRLNSPADLIGFSAAEFSDHLVQEFMPCVRNGERSLVFLGFDFQHAVLKKPCPGNPEEFRSNESLGGTVEVYQPTLDELTYSIGVLKAYESFGCPIHYSRVDFI
jgi:glutathione synthase/RimK-type ligase-like ATP-grasp enzyme